MSGGSYDYFYQRVDDVADQIREDAGCRNMGTDRSENYGASAPLRRAFKDHLRKVAKALRAIEWNDSGDGDHAEQELIRAVISPSAELDNAIARATLALAEIGDAIKAANAAYKRVGW